MNEFSASAKSTSAGPAHGAGRMFEGVQILRGIAASLVVFHHMCAIIVAYHPPPSGIAAYRRLADLGASGVDIFFCISGLVIAHAARKLPGGVPPALTFLWRRLLRVMPPYWVFTAALLGLWLTGIGLRELTVTPGFAISSFLLIPYPRLVAGVLNFHPILDVGWTLMFEMYFYAICAVLVGIGGGRALWPWITIVLGAVAVPVLAAAPGSIAAIILASPLLAEFAAGVMLARFVAGRSDARLGWMLIGLGALGLVGSIYLPDPMTWRALCWGIPAVALVAGAVLLPLSLRSRTVRFLSFLGTASYTIYLVHPFFMLTFGTLMKRGVMTTLPPDLLLILFTLGTVLGSSLAYFVVEGPLIQLLKPRSRTAQEAREVVSG